MAHFRRFNYRPNPKGENNVQYSSTTMKNLPTSDGGPVHSTSSTRIDYSYESTNSRRFTEGYSSLDTDAEMTYLPSKRTKYSESSCSSNMTLSKPLHYEPNVDIDFEDDDFESGLTLEDLDQLEIAATQALARTGNDKNISSNLFENKTTSKQGTVLQPSRTDITLVENDSSAISRNSRQSHEPSQTLELFTSTGVQNGKKTISTTSTQERITHLEQQLKDYDIALKEQKDKQFQRDGEIKILRESLQRVKEELRQQRLESKEVDVSRRQGELEREKNYQREIESLKTQLKFKSKEIDEALLRARVGQSPKARKSASVIDVPQNVDIDLLSQSKSIHRGTLLKDASEQTDFDFDFQDCIAVKSTELPRSELSKLFGDLHSECEICKRQSTPSTLEYSGDEKNEKMEYILSVNSMFAVCTHAMAFLDSWSKSNWLLLLHLVSPLIFLVKESKTCMDNALISKHIENFKIEESDVYYLVRDLAERRNQIKTNGNPSDDLVASPNLDDQMHDISYLNLKLFSLACLVNDSLKSTLVSCICFVGNKQEEDPGSVSSFKDRWDNESQHLSETEQVMVKGISAILIRGIGLLTSVRISLLLGKILTTLAKSIHQDEVKDKFLTILAEGEVLASIFGHQCKAAVIEGTEMMRVLSGCSPIKQILCNEKDNCPLLRICQYCVSKPDWLKAVEWTEFKLRIVQALSSSFATSQATLRQLLESECDCSPELVGSLILMLLPDLQSYLQKARYPNETHLMSNELGFILLRQGISLLVSVCLSDRFLIDHRADVEREYFHLLHGASKLFTSVKDVAESEVHAIHDLLEYDQEDDDEEVEEATTSAGTNAQSMAVDE